MAKEEPKGQRLLDVLRAKYNDDIPPKGTLVVGKFGIVSEMYGKENNPYIYKWIVSDRKDRRHGALYPKEIDPYNKSLFEEMFRKWKN